MPPWRHVRYDYERGLPLHRICYRYARFDGVGEAKILKLASQEGWHRPTPDPKADFGPLAMLDPSQPLPVVLLHRPEPTPAMPARSKGRPQAKPKAPAQDAPGQAQDSEPTPKPKPQPKPAQRPSEPKSKLPAPSPLPKRLAPEVQISDYKRIKNPIVRAIGARFRHFRLTARVSRDEILSYPGCGRPQREIERFEQGDWFAFSRMATIAQTYAKVLKVSPEVLCDIGATHLNVDVQELLFNTEYDRQNPDD
jgi:hypothetical protein